MDYPFENLDPERFQHFCQALLTKEFPDVQCFPIAQPDGGRDAIGYRYNPAKKFLMFQVKFVRNPFKETEPHKWIMEVVKEEAPKVRKQILKGAMQYILLTNVPGTAHSDVGSIDQVAKELNNEIGIPTSCWWRDDLNRRLDNAWNLKWVYPELMTGPDLLRSLIEFGLTENKERRSSAIRAFVKDQYSIDKDVKFKQIELQNGLLDLFIDVPIIPPRALPQKQQHHFYQHILYTIFESTKQPSDISCENKDLALTSAEEMVIGREYDHYHPRDERPSVGAATLLLHPFVQSNVPKIVLEGAPGQGKSTITQYICQIHRMRLLGKDNELQSLPDYCKTSPLRLPFKVDLRDLATWLTKRNPFSSGDVEIDPFWHKSLESFLAAMVRHHSGGIEFEISDLVAVAKLSALLLVFDGLDEIADISRRQEVVEEIVKGVNRMEENCASLQVVVTSRPAAFENSPGLPEDVFPYFQLDSLTRPLIDEYAGKWLKAGRIQEREGKEVRKILKEKLDQPHLRDLARNPMQLAILLSLIHTRGSSLPDKRTSLYDSYIELFFNREAEKSASVREHRALLIDIHRHIAWVLHVEAEQGSDGSISKDKLNAVLSNYLETEGHDPALASTLFTGMVERVVALVSRVEGTYEFEVQPLREYFAARFLYETAPYSPPGVEKKGTKPDRFDAIARNFYWLNVTRFYAGCYSKGELASLIDRLKELVKEKGYRNISHPRILTATLLSDWVFAQHPKSVHEVVSLILDGIGLRYILPSISRRIGSGAPLVLPKGCGNQELVIRCFELLRRRPPRDYALEIIDLIKANTISGDLDILWQDNARDKEATIHDWLEYGVYFGSISRMPLNDLTNYIGNSFEDSRCLELISRARRFDYFESSALVFRSAVESILSTDMVIEQRRNQSVLEVFCHALDAGRYAFAFNIAQPNPLSEMWKHRGVRPTLGLDRKLITSLPTFPEVSKCTETIDIAEVEAKRSTKEWASEITPWDNLIKKASEIWGDQWVFYYLANIGSGIKSQSETCKDYPELFDRSKSLCKRARYARLRAGTGNWWDKQFEKVNEESDSMFIIMLLLTWGSPKTLIDLCPSIEAHVKTLSASNWRMLSFAVKSAISLTREQSGDRFVNFDVSMLSKTLNERTVALLSMRTKQKSAFDLYHKYLQDYEGTDEHVSSFCYQIAARLLISPEVKNWTSVLRIISHCYMNGSLSEPYAYQVYRRASRMSLPNQIAEQITSNPDKYPGALVAAAEVVCKKTIVSKIASVGEIARKEKWF